LCNDYLAGAASTGAASIGATVESTGAASTGAASTGAAAVVSVSVPSAGAAELLQAVNANAAIAITNNFFILILLYFN